MLTEGNIRGDLRIIVSTDAHLWCGKAHTTQITNTSFSGRRTAQATRCARNNHMEAPAVNFPF